MADIRNSISLQDRMTPVFRAVIKSMDSTLRVMRNLDRQANKGVQSKAYQRAQRDIQRANNELIKMQNNLSLADKSAEKLAKSTNKVSNNMTKMRSSGGLNLHNLSHGLYLLKNIASVASDIMATPDTMAAAKYRLETYDTTNATGSQLMNAVYKTAQGSRSDIQSTADLASRILISGATNGNGAEAINLAGILNKASFLGGSSPQESQRALLQLSQGLASGALQGDELRAIREQAPGLTDTLAKGLSKLGERGALPEKFIGTTMGDLKELGSEGELTAGRIIAAFKEMEGYADTTFKDSPKLFGQAVTGIINVWKRWLGLMGEGDNALARINEKAWELLEWFESPEGEEFFNSLAKGVNFVVDGLFMIIDGVAAVIQWFDDMDIAASVLQSSLITLGIVAAAAGIAAAVSWAIANWQIVVAALAVGLLIFAFLEMGFTVGEVLGGIMGGIAFLALAIWDAVIWIITIVAWAGMLVWDLILALVHVILIVVAAIFAAIAWVIQGIVQLVIWLALIIDAIIITIANVIMTVILLIGGTIGEAVVGVYAAFVGLAEGVLGVLWMIAKAVDWIFGSNMADTVGGWMKDLAGSVVELEGTIGMSAADDAIEKMWANNYDHVGERFAGKGKYDDWNLLDNMADTGRTLGDFAIDSGNALSSAAFLEDEFGAVGKWGVGLTANPMDGWNAGYNLGSDLSSSVGELAMGLSDMGNIEDMLKGGIGVDGGDLDSVGSIKSDVDVSDEDIQLLRDMAARDFLLTLQTSAPQVNNHFGDIRETADVNKILEAISDMVDEQLAVSLVVE